jgi:transmembrane sensor
MKPEKKLIRYTDYELEDFLGDEFFIDWVKNPNVDNSHFWDIWLQKNPEKRTLILSAANIIRSITYAPLPQLSEHEYLDIFEKIIKEPARSSKAKMGSWFYKFFELIPPTKIAACFLICFVAWVTIEVYWIGVPEEETPVLAEEWIEKSTPIGVKSTFFLSDGSTITLNSESKIRFPKNFDQVKRTVEIEGEAFFEVKKENRPFIVQSGNTKIQVLGTSFNVNKKTNEPLYVALVTGKVSVDTHNGSRMTLEPNEMLVLEDSGSFRKTGFDSKDVIGWKDKFLVFKSSKLPEIKERLEQWYGVQIELKGKFDENWTYSGVYKDEILENVLRGICMTSGMNYKINDKKITLTNPKKHENS